MKQAFVPQSDAPILNGLEDVAAYEQEASCQQRYPLTTSYQLLTAAAERYGEGLALRALVTAEPDETPQDVSFQQLFTGVTQTANALHLLGIGETDSVAIMLPNMVASHLAIWGAQAAGIASPLNPLLEPEHLVEILNATSPRVLITSAPHKFDPGHWAKVQHLIHKVPSLEALLYVTLPGYTENTAALTHDQVQLLDFHHLIAEQPADRLLSGRQIHGDQIAAYFHTGGTTGRPKIAQVSHGNIAYAAQAVEHLTRYKGRSVGMSALPLFHIYGLISAGIGTLYAGRTIVVMSPDGFRNPNVLRYWWHHAGRFEVRAFGAVPTILAALMQVPTGDADLSVLEDVGSGAAPLPKQLRKAFEKKLGVRVTNGYGMTETTGIATRQRPESPGPEGSVGTRFPYTQVRTVVLDGNQVVRECEPNEAGVLLIRGPHVFKGYLDPEDNQKAWVEGDWLNTGDVAFIDADGFITLTGRAKDLIIRGGHNIDPVVIEEPLSKHPAVAQVVAVGQPDAYAGELPVAFVQLKPDAVGQVTPAVLIEYCEEMVPERAAVPKRIEFVDEMPVTAVGKYFKPALRNRAIHYVLSETLQNAGIAGEVDVNFETTRGHVAVIKLHNEKQADTARELLEQYPVTIEVA